MSFVEEGAEVVLRREQLRRLRDDRFEQDDAGREIRRGDDAAAAVAPARPRAARVRRRSDRPVTAAASAAGAGGTLRARVVRGLGWKVASQVFLQLSRLAVAVVLARLLTPHDFGVAGMVLVFTSLGLVFSDVALGAALVQRKELTEDDRSTVFWTSLGVGGLFTVAGIAAAGPIAGFYGEPQVRPLLIVLSFSFVIGSLASTQEALLVRELSFRSLELRLMAGTAAGAVLGIAVAARGGGAWAIVIQQLTIVAVSAALLWLVTPWRPRLRFSRASLRDLGGFSLNVFGQRVLFYVHRNADNLLIGRFLGAAALGAYAFSYNVMLVPFSRVAGPLQEVLFPAFSRMQDDRARMADVWVRATRLAGAFSVPALAGLAIVAPDFVHVVLGDRWSAAGPVLQVLAWVGLLQSLQTLNSNILQALDRTSTLFRYSVVFIAAHLTAFVVGLQWGVVGVAAAYALSSTVVEPLYCWITSRALDVSPLLMPRGLAGVAQASAAMAAAVLAARLVLVDAGVPPLPRLVALICLGTIVYVPLLLWRSPALVRDLRRGRGRATTVPAEAAA
jgi:O-antigen/teichoic acid export membrane protein